MDKFEDVDYWKGIVLYGLNQATYKIALGKTILELASQEIFVMVSFHKQFNHSHLSPNLNLIR